MILTEDEIWQIGMQDISLDAPYGYARAIESAVLENLKAQEPVGETVPSIVWEGLVSIAWEADKQPPPGTKLYTNPLPPADVVRDPRIAELEAVLRECRDVLSFINRLDDDRDFLDQPEYEQIHKAIAKIDEVFNGPSSI